jgi:DNA-binding transcriptional LysR family regulator
MPGTGRLPPLEWIVTFEAAARLGNFTAAARELGMTQAAVSQHLRKLEARLGTRFFHRQARGVQLTAEGEGYLPHARAAIDALARATEDLFGTRAARTVSVACSASFATIVLAPRLRAFNEASPHIRLSVHAVHRPADYDAIGADLNVRLGDGDGLGRPDLLVREAQAPVCAPSLKAAMPDGPWTDWPALALSGVRPGWSDWAAFAGTPPPARIAARFDSFAPALQAAEAGVGVLLASLPLAHRALASGALVRLSDRTLATATAHWLTRRPDARPAAAVDRVAEFIRQVAAELPRPARETL